MTSPESSDPRVSMILDAMLRVMRGDPMTPLQPSAVDDEIDGIMVSLNMLSEELDHQRAEVGKSQVDLETRVQDRTRELQESQTAHERTATMLRSMAERITEGLLVVDTEGRLLVFNPAAKALLAQGDAWEILDAPPKPLRVFRLDRTTPIPTDSLPLARALKGDVADDVEVVLFNDLRPDGVNISVSARPLLALDGRRLGAVAVF